MKKLIDLIKSYFSLAAAAIGLLFMGLWIYTSDIEFVILATACCCMGLMWDHFYEDVK